MVTLFLHTVVHTKLIKIATELYYLSSLYCKTSLTRLDKTDSLARWYSLMTNCVRGRSLQGLILTSRQTHRVMVHTEMNKEPFLFSPASISFPGHWCHYGMNLAVCSVNGDWWGIGSSSVHQNEQSQTVYRFMYLFTSDSQCFNTNITFVLSMGIWHNSATALMTFSAFLL